MARESQDENRPKRSWRDETFHRIISTHASRNTSGVVLSRRVTGRSGHFKLKGLLLLVLLAGGSFLLVAELPVISSLLNGIECGLATNSGSTSKVAIINEVG